MAGLGVCGHQIIIPPHLHVVMYGRSRHAWASRTSPSCWGALLGESGLSLIISGYGLDSFRWSARQFDLVVHNVMGWTDSVRSEAV